jgi:hypothetical protein
MNEEITRDIFRNSSLYMVFYAIQRQNAERSKTKDFDGFKS